MTQSRLDFVVFGASGFTGKYVVEEIIKVTAKKPLTWGIAGRNKERLQKVLSDIGDKKKIDLTNIEIIVADATDAASLSEMTAKARVILNCCGPFRFYGEAVVKACIENGASHIDISGEPLFMEEVQLKYNKQAEDAGVYIISACGLDCIPNDIGVVYLEQQFKGQVNSVESFLELTVDPAFQGKSAIVHFTTYESAVHIISDMSKQRYTQKLLYPNRLPPLVPSLPARSILHKSAFVNKWCLPFPAADRHVIERSQRFLLESENKRPVQVSTFVALPNLWMTIITMLAGVMFSFLAIFSWGRSVLLKNPRLMTLGAASHDGPSEEVAENSHFVVTLVGKGWNEKLAEPFDKHTTPPNKQMIVRVSGRNPGYGATSAMMVLCGLTILDESDRMPGKGGVLAPGAAFSKTSMISSLPRVGVNLEVVSTSEPEEKVSHSYLGAFVTGILNSSLY